MDDDFNAAPFNPLPPIVVALVVAILGAELVLQAADAGYIGGRGGFGWRLEAIERWGFYDPVWDWMVENRQWRWEHMARFVTYPFVHAGFIHAAFVLVFVLALGKMVAEVFHAWAVLVIFFGASIAGAVVYGLVWDTRVALIGGYPAAFGLIGAFSFLLWTRLAGTGASRLQAFSLIAMLMFIRMVFGVFFGGSLDWVAELTGFAAGFGLSFLVSPGGWSQVVARLRRR